MKNIGSHDGTVHKVRALSKQVESFSAAEVMELTGKGSRSTYRMLATLCDKSELFACGKRGKGNRRYTASREVADALNDQAKRKPLGEIGQRRKIGSCLGGLRTLESLKVRSVVDEDSGCWIWQWAVCKANGGSIPVANIPGNKSNTSVPRWAYQFKKGAKPLNKGQCVWRSCGCNLCVNPDHMLAGTRAEFGLWVRESKRWHGLHSYKAANKSSAKRRAVLTDEIVAELRLGLEKPQDAAKRLGVRESSVYRALRRTIQVVNSSVFNWRPAA